MANVLTPDSIDFRAYMRETEPAHKVRAAGVYVQELIDDLGTERHEPRAYLPWDKTHALFQFRPGEVTLWAGVNGQGKSMMTGLAALSLCTQGEKVCVASFEMKPRRTLERMARQWSGQAAPQPHEMGDSQILATFRDLYEQFRDWTGKSLWLYDQQGTVETEVLVGVIRYCARELGITHFFVDSLMKCIAGEDDYNGQKAFIDEMTAIARDTGMHIHVVHHVKKLADESKHPDKMDVKGSGAITDQVDNLLLVWRNKPKERDAQAGKRTADTEPDALLICEKQRNGEWEGRFHLWFDKDSQQYVGAAGAAPLNFYGGFPHRSGQ
jgi:twinkle protein